MARTYSTMLPLGTVAPAFTLPDTDGRLTSLTDFPDAKAVLVMFICNHCPYVIHVAAELAKLADDYRSKGVAVIAINSNDAEAYPDDNPEKMKLERTKRGYHFPYLFDATQAVAKAYRAACTPDFFVFDHERRLTYRGQLDDSRPSNGIPVSGVDLRRALDETLTQQPVSPQQKPSMGCNIKWRGDNAPDYFGS